jgi:Rrf2 family transcriptional regulator, cysteine metabolism repressor
MWISRRTDYATRAVLALALVTDDRPRKIHELAELTSTPESVLEQLLPQLRGAGIVRSERGPSGGYRLNHAPADITLGKVVRLIQGPLAPISCATRSEPEPCPMDVGCALQATWAEVRDATIRILDNTTFAMLVERSGGRWADIRLSQEVGIAGADR